MVEAPGSVTIVATVTVSAIVLVGTVISVFSIVAVIAMIPAIFVIVIAVPPLGIVSPMAPDVVTLPPGMISSIIIFFGLPRRHLARRIPVRPVALRARHRGG